MLSSRRRALFSVGEPIQAELYETDFEYPLVLSNSVSKPIDSISVLGAVNGVGEYDSELQSHKIGILYDYALAFNIRSDMPLNAFVAHNLLYGATWAIGRGLNQDGTESNAGAFKTSTYIQIEPSTKYFLKYSTSISWRRPCLYRYDSGTGEYVCTKYISNSAPNELSFTTGANDTHIRIASQVSDWQVLLVKSPVALEYFANDKIIADEIIFDVTQQTATHIQRVNNCIISPISTDKSTLQDWTQNFNLSKATSTTVTTNTTVAPSGLKMRYWRK